MNKKNIKITLPSLLGTKEFTPTVIMQKFALAFMQNLESSPNQVLKKLGHSEQLIYQWRAKSGFRQWLNMVTDDYMGSMGLAQVKKAAFREALKHSAQDRKLLLERYDPEYKPQSALDVNANAGRRPPDDSKTPEQIRAAIKRSEQRMLELDKERLRELEAEKSNPEIIGETTNEQDNTN